MGRPQAFSPGSVWGPLRTDQGRPGGSHLRGTRENVADRVRLCLRYAPADRLVFAPDCGLSQTARWAAQPKLRNLVAGVHQVRKKHL